ncbi:ferric reductase-like transmembrane domain-containing protein [Aliivibrio fischeri]|uniref:ferredoxin reductase family protein n=1 Tax=Aliivibrio fischeri TaxID=668 RepID=UPI0007C5927A|nr:ferric reductase-like transmembrane domain-containing protein [Aliivibrio fischeri]MCE7534764.1 ferric reductase-like transmembrane domain-containing protein [Aliivibrio fischeri]MCE7557400.1 ferric reductase-like transmembrane domain-containing protein [Aliivibrio fischeri]
MRKFTVLLLLLWLPSFFSSLTEFDSVMDLRKQLIVLTGWVGFAYMGAAIVLSARFKWTERLVKGLDKAYGLHKKLGISAFIALLLHWLVIKAAHWAVQLGWLVRPTHAGKERVITGVDWISLAEKVGDISFKVFILFTIISLVERISYKKFKGIHKIGGALMLAGVFHTLFLIKWDLSLIPMNIAIILISAISVWCAILSLTGSIGKKNKIGGQVVQVDKFKDDSEFTVVARLQIKLESKLRYKEGQFAYINFHDGEAPHPFSILNYNEKTRVAEFGIKDLGDYTHQLVNQIAVGKKATVEGGYGYFQIPSDMNQVWVGAGIGIVPLLSRLYWLQKSTDKTTKRIEKIHLFYCVNNEKEAFFSTEIKTILRKLDFIELHLIESDKGCRLTSEHILKKVDSDSFSVSFCGPEGFGTSLKQGLMVNGLPEASFHKEIFKMR